MYSITNVIYGLPLIEKAYRIVEDRLSEPEDLGFETMYHGNSEYSPGFIGVKLDEFNECALTLRFEENALWSYKNSIIARLRPTEKEVLETQNKIDLLPMEVRKALPDIIGTYFVFSTS